MPRWIDIKKRKPEPQSRVLVCDDNGYVDIEDIHGEAYYQNLGYREIPTFEEMWESGNGTKLVAWMPLPDWPSKLCREDADGEMP